MIFMKMAFANNIALQGTLCDAYRMIVTTWSKGKLFKHYGRQIALRSGHNKSEEKGSN